MENILEMRKISKAFYGVQALNNVDFSVLRGETHILLGENGAGKSTLMKILSGAYHKDAGEIYFDGEKIEISTPLDAQQKGISIIYQEFNLIPGLTVAENIFLGREPVKGNRLINWRVLNENAKAILDKLHADVSPTAMVATLSVAEQQFVEIAKALSLIQTDYYGRTLRYPDPSGEGSAVRSNSGFEAGWRFHNLYLPSSGRDL